MAFIDRHLAEGRGGKIAIRTVTEESATGSLPTASRRCANTLLGLGVTPGSRLLMMVLDGPAFFYLFWGAIKAGIVPVPINTLLRAADYAYLIEDSGARAWFTRRNSQPKSSRRSGRASHGRWCCDRRTAEASANRDVPRLEPTRPSRRPPGDDCYWLYSSGSTGRPKGAVHSHRTPVLTASAMPWKPSAPGRTTYSFRRPSCSFPMAWATP